MASICTGAHILKAGFALTFILCLRENLPLLCESPGAMGAGEDDQQSLGAVGDSGRTFQSLHTLSPRKSHKGPNLQVLRESPVAFFCTSMRDSGFAGTRARQRVKVSWYCSLRRHFRRSAFMVSRRAGTVFLRGHSTLTRGTAILRSQLDQGAVQALTASSWVQRSLSDSCLSGLLLP